MRRTLAALGAATAIAAGAPMPIQAFTLHTPSFHVARVARCSVANVGRIPLEVDIALRSDGGGRIPAPAWTDLPPGSATSYVTGSAGDMAHNRCAIRVRARRRTDTARRDMVRAGVVFTDPAGQAVAFPAY